MELCSGFVRCNKFSEPTKIRGSEPEPLLSASGHQEVNELGETGGETSGDGRGTQNRGDLQEKRYTKQGGKVTKSCCARFMLMLVVLMPKNKVKSQHCSCFALIVATTKMQKDCFATHSGVGLRQCFSHQVILRPYCPSKNLYYCTVASDFFVHFSHWQVYSFSTPGGCQCFTAFPHCSST